MCAIKRRSDGYYLQKTHRHWSPKLDLSCIWSDLERVESMAQKINLSTPVEVVRVKALEVPV